MASSPIVSSLPAYVEQNTDLLISTSLLEAKSASLFTLQTGVKGNTAINVLTSDIKFQNGKGCGFTAKGDQTMTQREIKPGVIKVNMEYCPDNLLGKYAQNKVNIAAGRENLPFEEKFMQGVTDGIAQNLEAALWKGDTLSMDDNLKQFDGLVKILEGEGKVVKEPIAKKTSKFEAVRQVLLKMPVGTIKEDTRIFCSPEFMAAYQQELVDLNLYHFTPGEDYDEVTIPGSKVKLVAVGGLSGIGAVKDGKDYLVGARLSNIVYGVDMENDKEEFKLWFSDDADLFRLKVKFTAGVQVAFPDEIVLGTIAAA